MDFNITEFDIRKKFSDSDLRAVIDYHLKNAESDFLDFKELPTEQEKKEKFYRDLPKDIQAFANNGGGILIIGVRQKPKNNESPIIGIQNYDTLVNNISQRQTLLRIQLLSVKIDYDGKEIVFVFIPSPEEAIEYKNNYIRRSGTVNVPLTEPNEIDKLKAEVLAREKGFTIITKLKELIPVYLTWIVNNRIPGYENFINRLLKIIHETNALTFKIFLFVVSKDTKCIYKTNDDLVNNQFDSISKD